MVKHRIHMTIALGKFNEAMAYYKRLNEVCRKKGWPEAKLWSPFMGDFNQLIAEWEYPDIPTLDKIGNDFQSDTEAMAAFRAGPDLAPGIWPRDEVLVEAPLLA
jgi:hypothetical protein